MKLYKLKSVDGDGFFYTLDMIVNDRIFLSTCESMNDINEGRWTLEDGQNESNKRSANKLRKLINSRRFTCFVDGIYNPLMWAHYAGGFSGIALEYEIDEKKYDLRKIYYDGIPCISNIQVEGILHDKLLPQDIGILKRKENYWNYEGEWRLYGKDRNNSYLNNIRPQSVIFGTKDTKYGEILRKIISKLDVRIGYLVQESITKFTVDYS
jgi:hypothetical protein